MGCENCGNNCIETFSDKCVKYTGEDYAFLNIVNGEYYDSIVVKLLDKLKSSLNNPVDLSCITDKSDLDLEESLLVIVDKICALTSSDITYDGERYCIGSDTISSGAVLMLGNKFKYSVSQSDSGSNISYDLSDIERSVPKDFRVSKVSAVISGTPKNGRSIIADSSKSFMGVNVSNDRFPVNLDLDVRVSTPNGDVKLTRTVSIGSPKTGEFTGEMVVRDFGSTKTSGYTIKDFNQAVALQVCDNKTRLDQLQDIGVSGCTGLEYSNTDLKSIISTQGAAICQLLERVSVLESQSGTPCIEGC